MSFDIGYWISSNSGTISAVAAVVAIIVAVVIAVVQWRPAKRQEESGKQLTEREEQQHHEKIDAAACSFLQSNSIDRQLVPLCFAAAAYDKTWPYRRKIYRDFCCLPLEVQNRIFEFEGLSFRLESSVDKGFFDCCVKSLEELQRGVFSGDCGGVLYDNGKYLRRCLDYSHLRVPVEQRSYRPERQSPMFDALLSDADRWCPYEEEITDVLLEAFKEGRSSYANPIKRLVDSYGFGGASEESACKFVAVLCIFLAFYGGDDTGFEYGSACDFLACSGRCTMEDLFLYALNAVYACLLRSDAAFE